MRVALAFAFGLLAACGQPAPEPKPDPWSPAAHMLYDSLVRGGWKPADARAHVDRVLAAAGNSAYSTSRRAAAREAERQQGSAEIRSGACNNDPSLSYC